MKVEIYGIVCVDIKKFEDEVLTIGKVYCVVDYAYGPEIPRLNYCGIIDDRGNSRYYLQKRFITLQEYRN